MISILRPSTPPLALISSAASCAAGAMDEPATACASEMTPILMGSAANARPAKTKTPQATTAAKFDIAPTCSDLRLMGSPFLYVRRFLSVPSDNLGATQAGWQV